MKNQPAENAKCSGMEGLEIARGIIEADLSEAKETGDADWIGQSQQALDAILAALSAQSGGERETIERCAKVAESFDTFDYDTALSARGATVAIGISAAIRALAAPQNPSSEGEGK